jgi:hypothetical protein
MHLPTRLTLQTYNELEFEIAIDVALQQRQLDISCILVLWHQRQTPAKGFNPWK